MAAVIPRASVQDPQSAHDVATGRLAANVSGPPQLTPPQSLGSGSASPPSSGPTSPQQQSLLNPPSRVSLDPQQRPVQIGRPKAPGFVPAALRPTERPRAQKQEGRGHRATGSRSGPPSPPQSLHNSVDNLTNSSSRNSSHPPQNALNKPGSQAQVAAKPAPIDTSRANGSRTSSLLNSPTASLSSLSLTSLAAAAAAAPHPTKAHWKPDAMAPACDAAACPIIFSTFTRRHHCRRCGGVFCYRHANRQVPLDGDARMVATPALSTTDSSVPGTPRVSVAGGVTANTSIDWSFDGAVTPDGLPLPEDGASRTDVGLWRACDGCHAEWINWTEGLREAAENANMDGGFGSRMQLPAGLGVPGADRKGSVAGSVAGSVPRDWSWSTF